MGKAEAVAMAGRAEAGHEGSSLEKANGVQRKKGDTPRACTVEIPATGAQLAAAVPNLRRELPCRARPVCRRGRLPQPPAGLWFAAGWENRIRNPIRWGKGRTAFSGGT